MRSCNGTYSDAVTHSLMATSYQLTKWRRYLLIRDSRHILSSSDSPTRMSICAICGANVFYRTWQLQAHHINPKSLFPQLALQLSNGVMLCSAHHQGIVHNFNPSRDIVNEQFDSGWKHYYSFFVRWNKLSHNRTFNIGFQHKLT